MSFKDRVKNIQWGTVAWLVVVWVLLWGDLSWGNVIGGFILGVVVVIIMPLPQIEFHGRIRLGFFLILIGRFLYDLVSSSFQVAMQAFEFGKTPHGAIVRVKLRSDSDLYMTLTSQLSCLVPGSLVIEAHPITQTLYVHVLDLESYGGADKVRNDVRALEARVMRAFASRDELERAGVSLRHLTTSSVAEDASVSTSGAEDTLHTKGSDK
jgi:multicomponent Na+:H+ antiporter subunit E